jgi:HSP20 family protein
MLPSRYTRPSISLLNALFDFEDLFEIPKNPLIKVPIHDVIENEKDYQVELLLAGVKKEDVKVDVDNDVLTIKAERKEVKDLKYNRKETYFGKYERSFVLPDNVDKENIDASLVDGVLKVIIPKLEKDTKLSKKAIEIK